MLAGKHASAESGADKLGWQMAIHSYTFQKFSIYDAIDKTAAMGLKHMSISGNVNLLEAGKIKTKPTPGISDEEYARILTKMKEKGLTPKFVNMGVVKPTANEEESRKLFAAVKRASPLWQQAPSRTNSPSDLPAARTRNCGARMAVQ